jgi:hypothetical protein
MRVGRSEIEQDFYAMLGVAPAATDAEIRRAHRRLARQLHPDLAAEPSPNADRRMKQVNLAASVLLNPSARARYDHLRGTGAHLRPEPPPRRTPSNPPRAWRSVRPPMWAPRTSAPPPSLHQQLRQAVLCAESPISSRLFVVALAMTAFVALVSQATREHAPVASSEYRIPDGPQMMTVWTPGN